MVVIIRDLKQLESRLRELGYGPRYYIAIQNNINPYSPLKYRAALKRTVAAKEWLRSRRFSSVKPKQKQNEKQKTVQTGRRAY